jgi:hypothetical protein
LFIAPGFKGVSELLGVPFKLAIINTKPESSSEVRNRNFEEFCIVWDLTSCIL